VLLQPGPTTIPIEDVEAALHSIMKPVRQYISTSGVATAVELCWVNREGNVSYRESTKQQTKKPIESTAATGPWSKFVTPRVETSNTYEVLTGGARTVDSINVSDKPTKGKKQEEVAAVPDNWENFEG
jgi:hypothetical protein